MVGGGGRGGVKGVWVAGRGGTGGFGGNNACQAVKITAGDKVGCRNQPLPIVLKPSGPPKRSSAYGPASQLERFPLFVPCHLSGRAVPSHLRFRKGQVQSDQPKHCPPHPIEPR